MVCCVAITAEQGPASFSRHLRFILWGKAEGVEQEQTKFYDLRRGITEDFQRLAKFQRTLSKYQKDSLILSNLCF